MLLYDLGGLLTLLGGMLLLCGLVAAFLYAIILQVGYIVAAWRSGISLWRKLLVPIVMAAWALPPVIAVSIKTLSVRNGLALEAWQWCVSALGVGVLWGGSVLLFSWRRSTGVSLAIFVVYTVMLLGYVPKPLDNSPAEVRYQQQPECDEL